jgi:O-antigen/teichoic acid export membrane protein
MSWSYIAAFVEVAVFFLLTPFVVQHFGKEIYGAWVLLHAIVFYLKFCDLGLYTSLVKFVSKYREIDDFNSVNTIIGVTLTMMSYAGIAAFIGSIGLSMFIVPHYLSVPESLVPEMQTAVLLFGAHLLIEFPGSVFRAIFGGYQRYDVLGFTRTITMTLTALATYAAIQFDATIITLASIEIISAIIAVIMYYRLVRSMFPEIKPRFSKARGEIWREVREYSGWISYNEILAQGASYLDKILIPFFLSLSMVTPYTLINSVAKSIFLVVIPVTEVFFSLSSAFDAKGDTAKLRLLLIKGSKMAMALSLPVGLIAMHYGDAFLIWWVGEEFVKLDGPVLQLVISSFLITAFIMTVTNIMRALGKLRMLFLINVIEVTVAITLALATIRSMGLLGLAGALLIANAITSFIIMVPYICKTLKQPPMEYLVDAILRPLLATLPLIGAIALADHYLPANGIFEIIVKSAAAGICYLVAFYFVSLLPDERREYTEQIMNALNLRKAA